MISWLFNHDFNNKKKVTILITIWAIILVVFLLTYPYESRSEYLLFQEFYKAEFLTIIRQTLKICLPFLVLILVMEHDQPYLRPMFAYFGVLKIQTSKYLMYYFYYLLYFIYLIVLIEAYKTLLIVPLYFKHDDFVFYLNIFIDGLILMNFVFYFIRDKKRVLSLLFGLLTYFVYIFYEDSKSMVYYLLPLLHPYYVRFYLASLYKVWYVVFGFIFCLEKNNRETIN